MKKTLKRKGSELASAENQLDLLEKPNQSFVAFKERLSENDIHALTPDQLEILQINLGYMCNMTCEHCHVDAGPDRKEVMTKEILEACLEAIEKANIHTVDLTGGAPEMNPNFNWFVEELSKRKVKVIVRSNLTILVSNKKFKEMPEFFKKNRVTVIASLPCYTEGNTDKQRGEGAFSDSILALKRLNELGYGVEGSELELNLVFNPGGPGLPPDQKSLELDYKRELQNNFGVLFNNLFTITNLPISRFLDYLLVVGRYEEYMNKLSDNFNPLSVPGLMCKNSLSVDWQGNLYDCDFNQMLGLKVESSIGNIMDFDLNELTKRNIVVKNHCLGCTAGAGSSCQGALV